jgi:hypothetical protein
METHTMTEHPLLDTMTLTEARARIPTRAVPDFWVGDLDRLDTVLDGVRRGDITEIATTPGGRALRLVAYGEREPLVRHANFNSAIGGQDPTAYADRVRREKPVVFFVGPVHGHETEAVTGLASLISVLESGADLGGRPRAELQALAERCRLLIMPNGNPDGMARFEPQLLAGMEHDDIRFWGQGTDAADRLWGWPGCKRVHPMQGEGNVSFLGCYFNDAGINPMHDEWFGAMAPETAAILGVARDEAPDLVVSLHSHQNPPALLRPAYVPLEIQAEVAALAGLVYARLDTLGLRHARPFTPQAEQGPVPASFNLIGALYHTSGAPTFTFECPHGVLGPGAYTVSPKQILEIQLALYTEMLVHALADNSKNHSR